jgi:hypothetical protein
VVISRLPDKQIAILLGIHHRKVGQSVVPAFDKVAIIRLSDPLTFDVLMAEATLRVRQEVARRAAMLPDVGEA